ncbi:hypothetical protein E4U36_005829, partial [Claviceps purpurea]
MVIRNPPIAYYEILIPADPARDHSESPTMVVSQAFTFLASSTTELEMILQHTQRWLVNGASSIQQQQNAYRYRPGVPTTLDNLGSGTFEVARMLHHDEQYCRSTTRLHQDVLRDLITALSRSYGLEDSRLSVAEKVIIFLDY